MNEELKKAAEALEGISYHDWTKLKTAVDRAFETEIGKFKDHLEFAEPGKVLEIIRSQFG